MVRRGADKWKTRSKIHAFTYSNGLKRDQSLVVVHGKNSIELQVAAPCKKCISTIRSEDKLVLFCFFDGRLNDLLFFCTDQAFITGMWIESKHCDLRFINPEITTQACV